MDFQDYQASASRTMQADRSAHNTAGYTLGLAGETGEIVELIKKQIYHGHLLNRIELANELGDLLWYVAAIASDYDLELDDIARANIKKLEERYPHGFSSQASQERVS